MMFNAEFLITPIGLILLITAFLLAMMHVLTSNRSIKDVKATRSALLEQAKKQSLRSFSVITSISDTASEVLPLIENLQVQNYEKLQLVITVSPNVKRGTLSQLKKYRKTYAGLKVKIISGPQSISFIEIVKKYVTGEYILKVEPDTQLTPNFFTFSSYSLINNTPALRVRMFAKPETSLSNGFYSILSLWKSLSQYVLRQSLTGSTLVDGVLLERSTLIKSNPYKTVSVLYEETAIKISAQQYKKRLSVSFASACRHLLFLAVCISVLTFTYSVTPAPIFLLSLSLLAGAYIVSTSLLLLDQKGLSVTDKIVLVLLIPFYPLWIAFMVFVSSIITVSATSIASVRLLSRKLKLAR